MLKKIFTSKAFWVTIFILVLIIASVSISIASSKQQDIVYGVNGAQSTGGSGSSGGSGNGQSTSNTNGNKINPKNFPLKSGSSGLEVILLQRYLNEFCTGKYAVTALKEDGDFGSKTKIAIERCLSHLPNHIPYTVSERQFHYLKHLHDSGTSSDLLGFGNVMDRSDYMVWQTFQGGWNYTA